MSRQCCRIKISLQQGHKGEGTCLNSYLRQGPGLLHPVQSEEGFALQESGERGGDVRWRVHLQVLICLMSQFLLIMY